MFDVSVSPNVVADEHEPVCVGLSEEWRGDPAAEKSAALC